MSLEQLLPNGILQEVNDMELIHIENLSFAYNNKGILNGISFCISEGETWAIIGKNGSGKSTFIKLIAGILKPANGNIKIKSRFSSEYTPKSLAKIISYVPQAHGRSLPPYTVYNYVMMGRFPYQGFMSIPSVEDVGIVKRALEITGTLEFSERNMTTLSGGELQRVFLAGAVAQCTEIMLLDEPAVFLDPYHQEKLQIVLRRIHEEFNTTLITITHDINFVIQSCSNILALDQGNVEYAGTVGEFIARCPDLLEKIYSLSFEHALTSLTKRDVLVPGFIC
jgi:ABC-type cobalamin/Fe3+-siderophores transport system ATPase subunit